MGDDTPHGERSLVTCRERNLHALHAFEPCRPRTNSQDPRRLASSSVPRKPPHQHVLQTRPSWLSSTRSPPLSFSERRLLDVARIRILQHIYAFFQLHMSVLICYMSVRISLSKPVSEKIVRNQSQPSTPTRGIVKKFRAVMKCGTTTQNGFTFLGSHKGFWDVETCS